MKNQNTENTENKENSKFDGSKKELNIKPTENLEIYDIHGYKAVPIVDLLIRLGDDAVINRVLDLKKSKKILKDQEKKSEKKRKIEKLKKTDDGDDDESKQEILTHLSDIPLANVEGILNALTPKQLKALQTASR